MARPRLYRKRCVVYLTDDDRAALRLLATARQTDLSNLLHLLATGELVPQVDAQHGAQVLEVVPQHGAQIGAQLRSDGVEPSRTRADKTPSLQREEEQEEETKTKTFVLGSPPEPSDLPSQAYLPGLAPPLKLAEAPAPRKPSAKEVELAWRVQETWAAHADKRRRFFEEVEGRASRPRQTPPPDIAREIRQAILEYDGDLLGPDQREEWRRESWARAAGLGIFLDPWCTAEHPENKMGEPGAKRYLEPWRPWHRQKSKGCPVAKYGDLYFQRRALDEGEREAVVASQRPPTAGAGHNQAAERPPLAIVRAAGG